MGTNAKYEFALILAGEEFDEDIAEALFEAGCDDGTYGVSCLVPSVSFHRIAGSLPEAIASAIRDVRKAGQQVLMIEPEGIVTPEEERKLLGQHGAERGREAWERMTPEQRAAVGRIRASHRTPEAQAEQRRVVKEVRGEVPPLKADAQLAKFLTTLRLERERQGLSVDDMAERTAIYPATNYNLENGRVPNPSWNTLRALARGLGERLVIGFERVSGEGDGPKSPS